MPDLSLPAALFVSACTAALAVAGFHLGDTIHGSAVAALVPAVAGGAGGFGAGWAGLDLIRRRRADPTRG